mgnify:CR=1 FL=1
MEDKTKKKSKTPSTPMAPEIAGSLIQGASSFGAGLLGGVFNRIGQHAQYKYQKKLAKLQHEYNMQTMAQQQRYAQQNYAQQRNDYLDDLVNNGWRQRLSKLGAGQSTSFSDGFTPAQPLGAAPDVPQGYANQGGSVGMPTTSFDASGVGQIYLQGQLIKAQKANIEADTWKKQHEVGILNWKSATMKRQLDLLNEQFPFLVDQAKETLNLTINQSEVTTQQRDQLKKSQDYLDSLTRLTEYDLDKLRPVEVQNMIAKTADTLSHIAVNRSTAEMNTSISELNKTKNFFASRGIGIGSNLIDSILAIASSPNASKLLPEICNNISTMFKQLHDSVTDTDSSAFEDFVNEVAHNKSMQTSLSKDYNNDFDAFFKYWRKTKVNGMQTSGEHSMRR